MDCKGNKILERYANLQRLWGLCLAEKLDTETRSRIIGCQSQMESFSFFFGHLLSHRLYSLTDNLSKTLQKEKMSALNGQRLANLTIQTLQGMGKKKILSYSLPQLSKKQRVLILKKQLCQGSAEDQNIPYCSTYKVTKRLLAKLKHSTRKQPKIITELSFSTQSIP